MQNLQPPSRRQLARKLGALAPLALTIALCLAVEEHFPFSDFPMYDGFSESPNFFYITDGDGEPVPVESITYQRTSKIKKAYEREMRERAAAAGVDKSDLPDADRRESGEAVLRWLYGATRPEGQRLLAEFPTLQLRESRITIEDGDALVGAPAVVAELRMPPP